MDVGIPQVHHLIALLAEMQGYEDVKANAVHWIGIFKDYDFKRGMDVEETAKVSAELLAARSKRRKMIVRPFKTKRAGLPTEAGPT